MGGLRGTLLLAVRRGGASRRWVRQLWDGSSCCKASAKRWRETPGWLPGAATSYGGKEEEPAVSECTCVLGWGLVGWELRGEWWVGQDGCEWLGMGDWG